MSRTGGGNGCGSRNGRDAENAVSLWASRRHGEDGARRQCGHVRYEVAAACAACIARHELPGAVGTCAHATHAVLHHGAPVRLAHGTAPLVVFVHEKQSAVLHQHGYHGKCPTLLYASLVVGARGNADARRPLCRRLLLISRIRTPASSAIAAAAATAAHFASLGFCSRQFWRFCVSILDVNIVRGRNEFELDRALHAIAAHHELVIDAWPSDGLESRALRAATYTRRRSIVGVGAFAVASRLVLASQCKPLGHISLAAR